MRDLPVETVDTVVTSEAIESAPRSAVSESERQTALWLTNASHAVNHFQNQMVSVLYPVILVELGFGYAQLGMLTAVRSLVSNAMQASFGFLTPFSSRARLLGIGNLVLALGTFLSGAASSFETFVAARTLAAAGSSAQHPVGSSLLAGYFPDKRGTVLAFNSSIATVGSLAAPLVAGLLLLVMPWRTIFFVTMVASLAMGTAYLLLRDRVGKVARPASRRATLREGWASYRRVFRDRNMVVVSLVMFAGAAGTNEGVNVTYLAPHFVADLGVSLAVAGIALTVLQLGGMGGQMGFGWLSDRWSRKAVLQVTLALSSILTLWVAHAGPSLLILLPSIALYGGATMSRNTLTQALVADSLHDDDRDAAFSVYYTIGFFSAPLWALLMGVLMESRGFTFAFSVLAGSYLAGMVLVTFIEERKRA